jgi:hypothetical protein
VGYLVDRPERTGTRMRNACVDVQMPDTAVPQNLHAGRGPLVSGISICTFGWSNYWSKLSPNQYQRRVDVWLKMKGAIVIRGRYQPATIPGISHGRSSGRQTAT